RVVAPRRPARPASFSLSRATEVSPRRSTGLGSSFHLDDLTPPARAVLRAVLKAADRDSPPALVGGAVRDALSGGGRGAKPIADVDVTVPSGALDLARRMADRLGGAFVPLDPERGAGRVVTRGAWLDVTDW